MTKVLLVDDHAAFRESLAFVLERETAFTVVAQASTLAGARRRMQHVDLALVDLHLPDGSGAELISAIQSTNPRSKVLLLVGPSPDARRGGYAGLGVGVVDKSLPLADILDLVHRLGRTAQASSS